MHWKMASKWGFAGFQCNCNIARQRRASSCIERFGKEHYRRWHNETYLNVQVEEAIPKGKAGMPSLKDRVTSSIFTRMWNLKAPATDSLGGSADVGSSSSGTSASIRFTRFAAAELGRSSTLATGAGAPMAWVCSSHTGPQIRLGTDDSNPDASAASASSAPWSISLPRLADFRVWRFFKKTIRN